MQLTKKCNICGHETRELKDQEILVTYDVCDHCGFIYKQKEHHVEREVERNRYFEHDNNFLNEGYVKMFQCLLDDYVKDLDIKGKVLDFGSGPTPVFKQLLIEAGYSVYDFDPFFNPDSDYLDHKYQLIASVEVIEHFSDPTKEFDNLLPLLEDNGYLLLMTHQRFMDEEEFLKWWYRRDITHVSFYTNETLQFIANKYNLEILKDDKVKVILLQKR